jgi:hypothetical protein
MVKPRFRGTSQPNGLRAKIKLDVSPGLSNPFFSNFFSFLSASHAPRDDPRTARLIVQNPHLFEAMGAGKLYRRHALAMADLASEYATGPKPPCKPGKNLSVGVEAIGARRQSAGRFMP